MPLTSAFQRALERAIEIQSLEIQPPPPAESRTCSSCRFAIFKDYGSSSYSVEGTEFFCSIGLHPNDGFDSWFGDDERLKYAAKCHGYREGDAIEIDVEGELEHTEYQKALMDALESRQDAQLMDRSQMTRRPKDDRRS